VYICTYVWCTCAQSTVESKLWLASQSKCLGLTRAIHICRVGQNRIYTPYMTVYLVISLPKIPYIHRIYMVLANPTYMYICTYVWCTCAQSTWQRNYCHVSAVYGVRIRSGQPYRCPVQFGSHHEANILRAHTHIYTHNPPVKVRSCLTHCARPFSNPRQETYGRRPAARAEAMKRV